MARSKREIPHYYLRTELDIGPALDWLRQHNREVPVSRRVLPAAVLLRAVALAARDVPELNGHWLDDRFVPGAGVHLGVAVSLRGGGLAAPVLHDARRPGPRRVDGAVRDAAERARAGTVALLRGRRRHDHGHQPRRPRRRRGDRSDPSTPGRTCRLRRDTTPPVGRRGRRCRPADVVASLAADHRASDGATGARLLHAIDQHLHRPDELAVTETDTYEERPMSDPAALPWPRPMREASCSTCCAVSHPGRRWTPCGPHDDLRDVLGLDSLDFLALVTRVSERTGRRIEEDDYERLADLDGWVRMLSSPDVVDRRE